jgi:hypothetical protein
MKIDRAFSTSIPRTLLSIMIFCSVALGAVVFLQNLEINGNSAAMKLQGLEVQQKNNTFLINLECINGKSASLSGTTVPQDKITSCVVANQSIGDYITESSSSRVGEEILGTPYTFKDVMSVVSACATQEEPGQTNTVKFQQGKSLVFKCPDNTSGTKKTMEIVAYK